MTDYQNTFAIADVSAQFKTFGNGRGTEEKLAVDQKMHLFKDRLRFYRHER